MLIVVSDDLSSFSLAQSLTSATLDRPSLRSASDPPGLDVHAIAPFSDTQTLDDAFRLAHQDHKLVLLVDLPVVSTRAAAITAAESAFLAGTWNRPDISELRSRHFISHVRYYDVAPKLAFQQSSREATRHSGKSQPSQLDAFPLPQPVSFILTDQGELVHLAPGFLSAEPYRRFLLWSTGTMGQLPRETTSTGGDSDSPSHGIMQAHRDTLLAIDPGFVDRAGNRKQPGKDVWTSESAALAVTDAWLARHSCLSSQLGGRSNRLASSQLAQWVVAHCDAGPNPGHYLLGFSARCPLELMERPAVESFGYHWQTLSSPHRVAEIATRLQQNSASAKPTVLIVHDNRLPPDRRDATQAQRVELLQHPALQRRIARCDTMQLSLGDLSLLLEARNEPALPISEQDGLGFVLYNAKGMRVATVSENGGLQQFRLAMQSVAPK
jgi:hypothetical protein